MKYSEDEVKRYWKIFARMTIPEKVYTLQQCFSISEQDAHRLIEKICSELERQELLFKYAHSKQQEKLSERDKEKLQRLKELRVAYLKKRKGRKRELIRLRYFWTIRELRQKGLGWRAIAEYLRKNHKFQISHVQLMKIYTELESLISSQTAIEK